MTRILISQCVVIGTIKLYYVHKKEISTKDDKDVMIGAYYCQ